MLCGTKRSHKRKLDMTDIENDENNAVKQLLILDIREAENCEPTKSEIKEIEPVVTFHSELVALINEKDFGYVHIKDITDLFRKNDKWKDELVIVINEIRYCNRMLNVDRDTAMSMIAREFFRDYKFTEDKESENISGKHKAMIESYVDRFFKVVPCAIELLYGINAICGLYAHKDTQIYSSIDHCRICYKYAMYLLFRGGYPEFRPSDALSRYSNYRKEHGNLEDEVTGSQAIEVCREVYELTTGKNFITGLSNYQATRETVAKASQRMVQAQLFINYIETLSYKS